jgi:hypothetical protein
MVKIMVIVLISNILIDCYTICRLKKRGAIKLWFFERGAPMKKIMVLILISVLLSACVNSTPTPQQQTAPASLAVLPTRTRMPTSTPVPITFTGCVDNTLRVRSGPGIDNEIIGRLKPQNIDEEIEGENFKFTLPASVSVIGRNQDTSWVMVSYEGQTGWVFADYINIQGDVNQLAVIGGDSLWELATFPPSVTQAPSSTSWHKQVFSGIG